MPESNVELARRGYEAMLAGDLDVVAAVGHVPWWARHARVYRRALGGRLTEP